MSAYLVYVRDRITDPAEFKKYEVSAPAASVGQPITPLAFYGAVQTLEGAPVDGAVILEFPTIADALASYNSPLYQEALQHRLNGADYRVFIIEGVPANTQMISPNLAPASDQTNGSLSTTEEVKQ